MRIIFTLAVLKETIFNRCMVPGDGGGIYSHGFLRQFIRFNGVLAQVVFDGLPKFLFLSIAQEDSQPVISTIKLVNGLTGDVTECLLEIVDIFSNRHFSVIALRQDVG